MKDRAEILMKSREEKPRNLTRLLTLERKVHTLLLFLCLFPRQAHGFVWEINIIPPNFHELQILAV